MQIDWDRDFISAPPSTTRTGNRPGRPSQAVEWPGFEEHLAESERNGIAYKTYWRRVVTLGWDPQVAATSPPAKCRPDPTSITSLCKRHGIDRRRFCMIRTELTEAGIEYTAQDVIDIVKARSRK